MEKDTLLLDTSIIFDIIGLNKKKDYINYTEISKADKCYSTFSVYEMLNDKDKFNKDEKTFKINIKKVQEITQDIITNIEFNIKDEVILNLDKCNAKELEEIKQKLFQKLKPLYRSIYNSIIIAFANFMFSGIVLFNKKDNKLFTYKLNPRKKKKLDYIFNQFALWLDNYVEEDPKYKNINNKDGIHKYFKILTNRMLNYLIITQKKMIRYSALGVKYSNKFLNMIKRLIMENSIIDKKISMSEMLQQVLDNLGNPQEISLDLMKSQMIIRLCEMVRFNVVNDTIRKYFKTWIELRYNLTDEQTWIENDIIDCFIACSTQDDEGNILLPISSDTNFIKNCCNSDEYKKYINFGLL